MTRPPAVYYHVAFVVEGLDAAIDEIGDALGLEFEIPREREFDGTRFRIAYTLEGPPFLELIERSDGSPFETLGFDHIGFRAEELDEPERLDRQGLRLEVTGHPFELPFTIHRGERSRVRVEVVGAALRARRRHASPPEEDIVPGSDPQT